MAKNNLSSLCYLGKFIFQIFKVTINLSRVKIEFSLMTI